jgi:alpha-beta hydrolase superfamily lysophospholipase
MFLAKKDRVVSPAAGKRFFANVASPDKSLVIFTEAMHELFQEEECNQVIESTHAWITDRV